MKNTGWAGKDWYCPNCGHVLKSLDKAIDYDSLSDEDYYKLRKNNNESENFICTNENCNYCKYMTLNLFHPIYGHNKAAGDSWAIGFIK